MTEHTDPSISTPVLRIEDHREHVALGIDEERPRLSWHLVDAPAPYRQDAYEISWVVTAPDGATMEADTVQVESAEQLHRPWPGLPIAPLHRAEVRVRTRDAGSLGWSPWSEPRIVERGLTPELWSAELVGPGYDEGTHDERRAPLIRGTFQVPGEIAVARLHLTAHGLVEAEINGIRVGRDELIPGWTPYNDRLRVYVYDVTDALDRGENVIGAWLADGWFRGRIGFEGGTTDIYGLHVGVLAQLEITLADGTTLTVGSDSTWRSAPGPLTRASLYDGERIDLSLEPQGWSRPGFDDSAWTPVCVHPLDRATLSAPDGPPVRATQTLEPVSVTPLDDGWLVDYGQNHSGRPRVRIPAAPGGARVVIEHAEVLEGGRLARRPLRQAAATDEVVTTGEPVEWEPRFTIHGYRYAYVTGWPTPAGPQPGDIVSRVLHSDMERTGWFTSDRADLNRLHENVVWGLRSNFVDIPTDCPQRDERLGWTGDIQVFAPTASFLYDVRGVLSDWLRSLTIEQQRYGGTVPVYVPWVPGGAWWQPDMDVAGWGDAAVLVPQALDAAFADDELLRRQYASARTWVDKVESLAGPSQLWDRQRQLGDWLDPMAPPDRPMEAVTDANLVATAYFARSSAALADVALRLDLPDDARRYRALADEVRAAYVDRYASSADPAHDTVCAHALSIAFDLVVDPAARQAVGDRLAALVRERGYRVSTGFLGTPVVTDALTRTGHLAEAYRMLLCHESPSWLATVDLGATTIWERWDSLLSDGTVNPGDMTSFNHYALGAVADWMHRTVGGLAALEPGYRRLLIAPRPGPGVASAEVRHLTPYGPASVAWDCRDGELTVRFDVPVGATAVVDLPGLEPFEVTHGRYERRVPFTDTTIGATRVDATELSGAKLSGAEPGRE